ncbi:MAG: hydrogenobyrinic acid a,c-diamide synthase (glutamine-hydrolyzing) [Actinobacteria bacterium 13_1_20CM_3_71_11]|nr:MAG: hydrogenobyrinic acid a,c-diamide synthase (glutamine-hydrolyzing) [Actinobacteria bacterium 13_1_20CM_3_71_11]
MTAVPRVVIAAPSSGHGKTAVAVGLLAALRARGLKTAGFKVGPDHVDAAYLGLAAGRPGRNLDPRLVGAATVGPLFSYGSAGADIAVVEGTMGLYDGLAGRTEAESTAQLAGLLRAPVVLVVDVAAMGQSVAALTHGFRAYDELLWLGGVILNRVASDRHEDLLRESLDEIGVPVLGAVRQRELPRSGLPARDEGVVPVVHHSVAATRAVRHLGEVVAGAVDLDRVLALARSAPRLVAEVWRPPGTAAPGTRPVIAVAGSARCAYGYAEAAELLTAAGAEVAMVDPLRDETLPGNTSALVVGGGLPEAYLDELAANVALATRVRQFALTGRPIVAEGIGLAWLAREFDGRPMCGVLDVVGRTGEHPVVGYREATVGTAGPHLSPGTEVVGYKQHRGLVTPRAGQHPAWSWPGGQPEGFVRGGVHASYLCLHWAGRPDIASRLITAAASGSEYGGSAEYGEENTLRLVS